MLECWHITGRHLPVAKEPKYHLIHVMVNEIQFSTSSNDKVPLPWIHRTFLSNPCKLKCRERYLHSSADVISKLKHLQNTIPDNSNIKSVLLIPDPFTFRLYLPVLEELVPYFSKPLVNHDFKSSYYYNLIVTESLAEFFMDAPPSMNWHKELNSHERKRMLTLLQNYPQEVTLVPYFDDEEGKSCSVLDYASMSVQERCWLGIRRSIECFEEAGFDIALLQTDFSELEYGSGEIDKGGMFSSSLDFISTSFDIKALIDDIQHGGVISKGASEQLSSLVNECNKQIKLLQNPEVSSIIEEATLSETDLYKGIQNGTLLRGILEVTKQNTGEAYVIAKSCPSGKVYVQNPSKSRAIHGDEVVIKILPQRLWRFPLGRRKLIHVSNDNEDMKELKDGHPENENLTMMTGQIVGVLSESRRKRRAYVATITDDVEYSMEHGIEYVLAVPMDTRIPKIRLHTRQLNHIAYKRLLLVVDKWESDSVYPSGHLKDIIGPVNSKEVEIKCLLLESGINFDEFSLSALACVPSYEEVPVEDSLQRLDLRNMPIFSVDPVGCEDIDDSFHIRRIGNGEIELGIHIADVSYFLEKDSALDREAANKTTTFYLVDRRYDMLPLKLMHLCSLHGQVDRFAFSVTFRLDEKTLTKVNSVSFGKSIIKNCAALTYEQADFILQGRNPNELATSDKLCAGGYINSDLIPILRDQLSLLTELGRQRKTQRGELGALELRSVELKFKLDENGHPSKVIEKEELEIHNTVAELMIMANEFVAKQIYDSYPSSALLRIHSSVSGDKFEELEAVYKVIGLNPSLTSNKEVANALKRSQKLEQKSIKSLLFSLTTKAMNEAAYICAGSLDKSRISHYGLGLQFYTHFTSPIRRYADVIVHRLLFSSISFNKQPSSYDTAEVTSLCSRLNFQNRTAKQCSLSSQKLFLSLYFQSNIEITQAVIVGLRDNGVLVYVPKFDIKGPLYLMDKDGCIQIDPKCIGLSDNDGSPPSVAFKMNPNCRKFTDGDCKLFDSDDESKHFLQVSIEGAPKPYQLHILDVIHVQISCDSSESRARVPQIMFHLVHKSHTSFVKNTSIDVMRGMKEMNINIPGKCGMEDEEDESNSAGVVINSLYSMLSSIEYPPKLPHETIRYTSSKANSSREKICPGRFQFGNFRVIGTEIEPTRTIVQTRTPSISDYDAQRRMERTVTTRIQKLAAEKRHARKSKANK